MEKRKEVFSWIKAILIAVILAFLIRTYIFAPIVVDGESMMPTLQDHERIVLTKFGTNIDNIDRFDIVVFHATVDKDYIKRVIGLPGDHIEYKDDTLYINGKAYEEPYLDKYKNQMEAGVPLTESFKLEDISGSTTVPEGQLFLMGDNRQNSLDSREIGTISVDEIVGKANLVYWPINEIKLVK
ncbi:signal peptidase I [Peribacillus simplex NBRC 15720 = DSM 1321]|uniref:Signal peptidase I n=1 Tax=Peribacillus simplex NBRC 15720 = DSM 1321 TaxID=1349754 RepID=A0A223EKQ6_9BACI|nr:signal peptidase I [Peribacillus simplex]ASS95828.1 signal peptidase I [Peribacillus simplex NBRC 15720 = DSM 1321]MED3984358.1 signal peptidase I [Peribacillus simplex]CAH0234253.1 Signal peptidase IB [Peribacillus simplex]